MRPSGGVTPQLVFGSFLMVIGALLMLDRLDILDAGRALRFWPLAFIGVGATLLAARRDGHGRFWGYFWLFIGSWMLLNSLGIVRVGFWDLLWPLLLVAFGISLIVQTMRRGRSNPDADRGSNLFAILGGSKRIVTDNPFTGAQMTSIMGGCHLDLSQAVIPPGREAVIDVAAFMGGHEIRVPDQWAVVSEIVPIASGVDQKASPTQVARPVTQLDPTVVSPGDTPPHLILRGFLVMSGLTIKN